MCVHITCCEYGILCVGDVLYALVMFVSSEMMPHLVVVCISWKLFVGVDSDLSYCVCVLMLVGMFMSMNVMLCLM